MNTEAPFDIIGVSIVCHGQQLTISHSSPAVCLACRGVFTLANELSVNFQAPRPQVIATPPQGQFLR